MLCAPSPASSTHCLCAPPIYCTWSMLSHAAAKGLAAISLSCFSSCSALHVPFALYDWIQDVNLDSFCVELLQQSAEVGPARVSFDDVRNPFPLSFRHAISVSAHVLHFIWSCMPCGCQIHVCMYVCMYCDWINRHSLYMFSTAHVV